MGEKKKNKGKKDIEKDDVKEEETPEVEDKEKKEKKEKKKDKKKKKEEDEPMEEEKDLDKEEKKEKKKDKKKKKDKEEEDKEDAAAAVDEKEDKKGKKKDKKKKDKEEEPTKEDNKGEDNDKKVKKKRKIDKENDENKEENEHEEEETKEKKKKKENKKEDDIQQDEKEEKKEKKKEKKDKKVSNVEEKEEQEGSKEKKKKEKKKDKSKKGVDVDSDDDIKERVVVDITPLPPDEFHGCDMFTLLTGELQQQSLDSLEQLIDTGVDVNGKGKFDETFLHILMAPRDEASVMTISLVNTMIYQMVNAGVDINAKDQEGNTPLHIASLNDVHKSTIAALIKCGADPCALNHDDHDAYDLAEMDEIKDTLKYFDRGLWRTVKDKDERETRKLVNSWCKLDIRQERKELLVIAERGGNERIVESIREKWDTNALVHACLAGDLYKVKELTKGKNADLETRDESHPLRYPILCQTALCRRFRSAKLLVKAGASVNSEIELGPEMKEPLYYFLLKRLDPLPVELFKKILAKADLSLIEPLQVSHFDMFYEAWNRKFHPEIVDTFINTCGFKLCAKDKDGYTTRDKILQETYHLDKDEVKKSLHYIDQHVIKMATNGKIDELKLLASEGYDYINIADKKGKSIYKLAKKEKQKTCAKFLEELYERQVTCYKHIETFIFNKIILVSGYPIYDLVITNS